MNKERIIDATRHTHDGTLPFPAIVGELLESGVEFYFVDYLAKTFRFYDGSENVLTVPLAFGNLPAVSAEWDGPGLQAAILDSQQNGQRFRDFCERAVKAGVQGYFAFLKGQRVTYLGRRGDAHTEWFPGAKP